MSTQYTRKDYVNKTCTHREYYSQFVTPFIISMVIGRIGADRIINSKDVHFNDIPLQEWNRLHGFIGKPSLCESVCAAKEAAQQYKEAIT